MKLKCYSCEDEQCFSPNRTSFCNDGNECWSIFSRGVDGKEKVSRGCQSTTDKVNYCSPAAKRAGLSGHYNASCCAHDLCNSGPFPTLAREFKEGGDNSFSFVEMMIPVSFLIFIAVGLILFIAIRKRRSKSLSNDSVSYCPTMCEDVTFEKAIMNGDTCSKSQEKEELSMTSGSGWGGRRLTVRNFAKHIEMGPLLGRGKYGEVYCGRFQGDYVAVKVFKTMDETSWSRETQLYSITGIRHSNILTYLGSDVITRNGATEMWLITEYHARGSLFDCLNGNKLDHARMCKILISIITGINHLHTEVFSNVGFGPTKAKPAIAHRDLKSKNILMKEDDECVIADFGLAVTYYAQTGKTEIPTPSVKMPSHSSTDPKQNMRVGTKRYMSPEILNLTLNPNSRFDSFCKTDIYALGLILWEVCRRTSATETVEEYAPPFYECVDGDPSFEEMQKIVCFDNRRPTIPQRWLDDPVLHGVTKLMTGCWCRNPDARLTALRLLKNINKLSESVLTY